MKRSQKALVIMLLILTVILTGCGKEQRLADLNAVKEAGVLKVGVVQCPPYGYEENGIWQGFDCALVEAVAKELGVGVEFVPLEWSERWLALNDGSVDCVWGCISATDDLGEQFGLSQSYLTGTPVLVVSPSAQKQTGFAGEPIAAEDGSACALAAEICLGDIALISAQGQQAALEKVSSGEALGAVVDAAVAQAYGDQNLVIREDLELGTLEFKAVFRQNSDLTEAVDKALTALQDTGELEKLADEYGLGQWLVVG